MKSLKTLLQEVTAGIKAWANANFSLGTHVHGNVTNNGKLATASKALVTDSNKNITTSSVSDTELSCLSGVTSAIQTQLNTKATDSDVVHTTGNETIGGKKTFTDSVFCKGSFFLWTNANVVKGTVPQTTIQPYRMYFGDAQNYASSLFNIDPAVGNDGTQTFTFRAAENVVNGDDARFALVYNPNRTQPRYLSIKGGVEPNATNSYDLGSSSYQWNNLYAQSYYYNGTAWGLDKANVWTNTNTFRQNITYERTNLSHNAANPCYILKDTGLEKGTLATTHHAAYAGNWQDKNSAYLGYMRFVAYDTGRQTAEIRVSNIIKNGALDPTGTEVSCTALLELQPSGKKSFSPEINNDVNLGTSTNKWKTLNGINPGALSLPDTYTNIDTTNWVLDGTSNHFVPTSDGWLGIQATDTVYDQMHYVFIGRTSGGSSYYQQNLALPVNALWDSKYHGCIFIPVIKNCNYDIRCICSTIVATFYPCQGNV